MAKKATVKAKNPPDLTLRNLHAATKRTNTLEDSIARLVEQQEGLLHNQELIFQILLRLIDHTGTPKPSAGEMRKRWAK